jgi:hypothetical protein
MYIYISFAVSANVPIYANAQVSHPEASQFKTLNLPLHATSLWFRNWSAWLQWQKWWHGRAAVFTKEDTGDVPEPAERPVSKELNKVTFNVKKVRKYIA